VAQPQECRLEGKAVRVKHVAIIGGGLGGLAAGLRLRKRGFPVSIFEAGATFGGKMNRWEAQGFVFDTGPSLITMPWVFEDLFRAAGSSLDEHVTLTPLHPLAEYFFDDGTRFTYTSDLPAWLQTLKHLDARDVDGFFRFQKLGARIWEVSKQTFMRRTPTSPPSLEDLKVLRNFPLRHGWGNYHRTVESHFHSPHLIQMFDRYPTYVGSSPYRSPATLALIPYLEFAFGGYAVKGGLYSIVAGLATLSRQLGIELCTDSKVVRIEVEQGTARAVYLASGERVAADIFIMNGDSQSLANLLGEPERPDDRSMSGFVTLLGIKRDLPELEQHSIFFSADYRREFSQIFDEKRFPDDPTVYVNAPSRADRSLVPGCGETLFIMANSPATGDAEIGEYRKRVFARLRKGGFPEIQDDIVIEDCWTPARIAQRYLMPGGAIYGSNSHGWKNAFLRPPNRHERIRNLYRVGGSTHPGGGTPTVLLSAQITCDLIEARW
jgi:phytoene desaturase